MLAPEKLQTLQEEYEQIKERLLDPNVFNNLREVKTLTRRHNLLEAILAECNKYNKVNSELQQTQQMLITEKDPDLLEMASEEVETLQKELEETQKRLQELFAVKDPNDDKNAIVEIRAGTGGEEAALFVADLYRMYSRFAEFRRWKKTVITSSETGLGGLKEVAFTLEGENCFGTMRFESGVHRVQRIPETEASGRIHTSAVTVAVLPEADEVDVNINENDLKIDVYRSSGHGGQSVNTTDSAVRITHLPSGIVVTCQDEKSQIKNKAKAMKVLRSRLLDLEIAKNEAEIARTRRSQVSTGDRSAKIRTYNFPQQRITDHRINLTSFQLSSFLDGYISEFIDALRQAHQQEMQ